MSVKVSEKSNARRRQNKVDKSEIVSPITSAAIQTE